MNCIAEPFHHQHIASKNASEIKKEIKQNVRNTLMPNINDLPDKENCDPIKDVYSPRYKKPGAIRRAILRDITEKFKREMTKDEKNADVDDENDECRVGWDEEIETLFDRLKDSPHKKKNMREL